jgi:2-dehydro-3-deoxyphosphogluconate aldolase/(4S)-4-hydroxy-2-oxoglutarate aldolase
MSARDVLNLSPIVPVIAIDNADDALPLAEALLEGGINIMEITLRTEAGLKAIETIAKTMPQMHVGAGTVISGDDFERAVEHGSQFVFSPGISLDLIQTSEELSIPLIPGVATASEVMLAINSGISACKLFPATAVGGVELLKGFSGPFSQMMFCPTGGINLNNMNSFLALKNVACVGGSWIVPKDAMSKKDFAAITKLSREALGAIQ